MLIFSVFVLGSLAEFVPLGLLLWLSFGFCFSRPAASGIRFSRIISLGIFLAPGPCLLSPAWGVFLSAVYVPQFMFSFLSGCSCPPLNPQLFSMKIVPVSVVSSTVCSALSLTAKSMAVVVGTSNLERYVWSRSTFPVFSSEDHLKFAFESCAIFRCHSLGFAFLFLFCLSMLAAWGGISRIGLRSWFLPAKVVKDHALVWQSSSFHLLCSGEINLGVPSHTLYLRPRTTIW